MNQLANDGSRIPFGLGAVMIQGRNINKVAVAQDWIVPLSR